MEDDIGITERSSPADRFRSLCGAASVVLLLSLVLSVALLLLVLFSVGDFGSHEVTLRLEVGLKVVLQETPSTTEEFAKGAARVEVLLLLVVSALEAVVCPEVVVVVVVIAVVEDVTGASVVVVLAVEGDVEGAAEVVLEAEATVEVVTPETVV